MNRSLSPTAHSKHHGRLPKVTLQPRRVSSKESRRPLDQKKRRSRSSDQLLRRSRTSQNELRSSNSGKARNRLSRTHSERNEKMVVASTPTENNDDMMNRDEDLQMMLKTSSKKASIDTRSEDKLSTKTRRKSRKEEKLVESNGIDRATKPRQRQMSNDSHERRISSRGRSPGRHRDRSPGVIRRGVQKSARKSSPKEGGTSRTDEGEEASTEGTEKLTSTKRSASPGRYCRRAISPGKYRGLSPGKYQPRVAEDIIKRARSVSTERLTILLDDSRPSKRNLMAKKGSSQRRIKGDMISQSEHSPKSGPRYVSGKNFDRENDSEDAWLRRRKAHALKNGEPDRAGKNKPKKTRSNEELRMVTRVLLEESNHKEGAQCSQESETLEGIIIAFPAEDKKQTNREELRASRLSRRRQLDSLRRASRSESKLELDSDHRPRKSRLEKQSTAPTKVKSKVSYFEELSLRNSREENKVRQ